LLNAALDIAGSADEQLINYEKRIDKNRGELRVLSPFRATFLPV